MPRKRRKKKESKVKAWKLSGLRYGFEKMRVVFLQLPLFEKKEPECMDIFDCWIYVLNNMEQMRLLNERMMLSDNTLALVIL